jgi:hypothetical protein
MSDVTGSGTPMDDLLGAYALDAVDPTERELVERHLANDPVARGEVDEMRETAALLASLPVGDEGAPAGLWDRIAGAIGAPTGAVATEPAPTTVVSFAKPKRAVPMRVAVALGAVAALVIAILAVQVATQSPSNTGNFAAAFDHAVANGATTVKLQRDGGTGSVAAEIALQADGSGFVRNDSLAALPEGKTYQLWALVKRGKATRAISAGVLGADPAAAAFHLADAPAAFAITVENGPGVVRSRNDPVAQGALAVQTTT